MAGFLPKDYVGVHTRIEKYHEDHTEGMSIITVFRLEMDIAIFTATVTTKKGVFNGSSFGKLEKEKAFEKLETIAVGRALAFAGYEVKSGIASNEEIQEWDKKKDVYEMTIKDVEDWNGKIYPGNTVYVSGESKKIGDEQIKKLKKHEKYVELPPKK